VRAAFRAELLKLRTTKTTLGLAAAMLALVTLAVTAHSLGLKDLTDKSRQLGVLLESGATLGPIFAALFGAMAITAEIRHGTIRPTFLGIPQRGRVIAAKAATSVAVGILFGLLATSLGAAIGTTVMSARGFALHLQAGDYVRLIIGGAVASALMAVIGLAVGIVVRNQVAAIAGLFLWLLFVENILADSVASVNRYMPGGLARALAANGTGLVHSPALALVILAAYAAAAAAIGWKTALRRDFA
jgi:ABC-type transport system involved in multi-copper enzyme maturation permease subunit